MMFSSGGDYRTLLYSELYETVRRFATVVSELGIQRGDRLVIQSENCPEWAWLDWACQCLGIVVVPIYPTLPADQSQYIVQNCGARIVVAGGAEQAAKSEGLADVRVVLLKGVPDSLATLAATARPMELDGTIDAIQPSDIATFIYTSGTTGAPKGAMLKHESFTFICDSVRKSLPITEQDVFLSFLPMSHVYERVAGQVLPLSLGACIAYAQNLRTLASDMQRARPTVMLCVPRFLEATREKIVDTAMKGSGVKRFLFKSALSQGAARVNGRFAPFAGLLDKLVGAKIREKTGGRIRFFVSGGAALAPHVSEFYRAFRLNVLQGYGLTETTAATCVNHPDDNRPWTVGPPLEGIEVRIAGDGEILVRGPSVMVGYHDMPEETRAAIDESGWFHTGDIGEFEGKNLKITDRKKDLLVLANGKNVAPQPIENKLKASDLISEAVLFGDGMEFVSALVIPNRDALNAMGIEQIASNEARAAIKKEVDKVNATLADFEKVKRHTLLDAEFSIESGELTPSLKVRRKVVKEKYADLISEMGR